MYRNRATNVNKVRSYIIYTLDTLSYRLVITITIPTQKKTKNWNAALGNLTFSCSHSASLTGRKVSPAGRSTVSISHYYSARDSSNTLKMSFFIYNTTNSRDGTKSPKVQRKYKFLTSEFGRRVSREDGANSVHADNLMAKWIMDLPNSEIDPDPGVRGIPV